MSWLNFAKLIDDQDKNISHWLNAIEANPNTPEAALKAAILGIVSNPNNGEQLESLCSMFVQLIFSVDRLAKKKIELVALRAMLMSIEFEVVSKCCPVCGANGWHDSACVLAAFLYPEKASSYHHHTHDTHINEMTFRIENDPDFASLRSELRLTGYFSTENKIDG
jgi:hypothetical protein